MAGQVIARDKLGALTKIAQGGQGVVFQAPNVKVKFASSMVFKEYKPQTRAEIDVTALAAMPVLVEQSLSYAQAEQMVSIAAWPCALVEDTGSTTGFVMPAIPQQFFTPLITAKGTSSSAAEFQHLLNHPSVLEARGITIDDAQRYSLLRETASGLAFLHKHGVCVGDISPKNLLFALTPHPSVYFIDCDAMRINGVSVLPQVETPGWQVPAGEELATVYSDAYKLALLALRLLAGDHDTTNPQHLPATTPDLLRQVITDTLSNPPQRRPLPDAWNYVLGNAIEQAQHQRKTATPTPASTAAAPPQPVVHSRPSTPTPPSAPPTPPPTPQIRSRPATPTPQSTPPSRPERPLAWERPPRSEGLPAPEPLPPAAYPTQARKRSPAIPLLIAAVVVLAVALALAIGIPALTKRLPTGSAPIALKPSITTSAPATITLTTVPPVAEAALDGLLLTADQINATMGTTAMTFVANRNAMLDSSAHVSDSACLPFMNPAESAVYSGSGASTTRGVTIGDEHGYGSLQMLVLFSSAEDAHRFFTTSAQQWPNCSNRQFTETWNDNSTTPTVGAVSDTNGILSAPTKRWDGNAYLGCERALTIANNVAIDIQTCNTPGSAVNIARQIAAKVPTT